MSNELARVETAGGLVNWQMMKEQSSILVKSGFLPKSITTPEQAMAIILTGQELGLPAMQALRGINVIQGQPTLKPELMLALCVKRVRGFKYSFGECSDTRAEFTCSRPEMSSPFVSTFTIEDAKRAGLTSNATYQKYPANMLRWRAVGNALHIVAPDVLVGIYTPDELGAIVDAEGAYIDVPAYGETRDLAGSVPANVDTKTGEIVDPPGTPKADPIIPKSTHEQREEMVSLKTQHKITNEDFNAIVMSATGETGLTAAKMNIVHARKVIDRIKEMCKASSDTTNTEEVEDADYRGVAG